MAVGVCDGEVEGEERLGGGVGGDERLVVAEVKWQGSRINGDSTGG